MLRKILEKVTKYKTSRTLQINVFEIPYNKNIWKLFSRYELLCLDQANCSSDLIQILITHFPTPRASPAPSSSLIICKILPYPAETPLQHHPHYVFHRFLYFVHTPSQVLDKPNHIPSQAKPIKLIINLYADHNTIWANYVTHQKAESLRADSLSKLDNMVNNNSISNTNYVDVSIK